MVTNIQDEGVYIFFLIYMGVEVMGNEYVLPDSMGGGGGWVLFIESWYESSARVATSNILANQEYSSNCHGSFHPSIVAIIAISYEMGPGGNFPD